MPFGSTSSVCLFLYIIFFFFFFFAANRSAQRCKHIFMQTQKPTSAPRLAVVPGCLCSDMFHLDNEKPEKCGASFCGQWGPFTSYLGG